MPRRFTNPETPGLFFWLDEPVTVDPSAYALDDFESLPNLETVLNVDAREALDDFATADVLILSLSSLGYLGGLLNPARPGRLCAVVASPAAEWLVSDAHGNLDTAELETRVADHLRRRRA